MLTIKTFGDETKVLALAGVITRPMEFLRMPGGSQLMSCTMRPKTKRKKGDLLNGDFPTLIRRRKKRTNIMNRSRVCGCAEMLPRQSNG